LLIGSGWKPVSMVDVYKAVTFTLWLCGCNLKCPFCHNWRLAEWDREICRELSIEKILGDLKASKPYIDYFHVTGGEPLLQYRGLKEVFSYAKDNLGVATSLNSNLTLPSLLSKLVREDLIDHVATDLKVPFSLLSGYNNSIAETLWRKYLESLRMIAEHEILLELRVPVARGVINKSLDELHDVLKILKQHSKLYVVVQPLLSIPVVNPRSIEWCEKYCGSSREELYRVASILRDLGFDKVYVKEIVSGD